MERRTKFFANLEGLARGATPATWEEKYSQARNTIDNFLDRAGRFYDKEPRQYNLEEQTELMTDAGKLACQIIFKHHPRFKDITQSLTPESIESKQRRNEFLYQLSDALREFIDLSIANPAVRNSDWGIADPESTSFNPETKANRFNEALQNGVYYKHLKNRIEEPVPVIQKRIATIQNYSVKDASILIENQTDDFTRYITDPEVLGELNHTDKQLSLLRQFTNKTMHDLKTTLKSLPEIHQMRLKYAEKQEQEHFKQMQAKKNQSNGSNGYNSVTTPKLKSKRDSEETKVFWDSSYEPEKEPDVKLILQGLRDFRDKVKAEKDELVRLEVPLVYLPGNTQAYIGELDDFLKERGNYQIREQDTRWGNRE